MAKGKGQSSAASRRNAQAALRKALERESAQPAPRRYRLVGSEVQSAVEGHRCFVVDDWRLTGAQLTLPAAAVLDEQEVEGRDGRPLASFAVEIGTPVVVSRRTTVEHLMRPLLRELLGFEQRALRRSAPWILAQQQPGGGVLRQERDGDIELTIGAKDQPVGDPDRRPDTEFTVYQMKESVGLPDDDEDDLGLPHFTDVFQDPLDDEEETPTPPPAPTLPAGTYVSPQETTDTTQDALTPRTSLIADPLTLSIMDWTVRQMDAPKPDPTDAGPVAPPALPEFTAILEDFAPPPKTPMDDLTPPPTGPGDLERILERLGEIFTLPRNLDPEADPNERRLGLDIRLPW